MSARRKWDVPADIIPKGVDMESLLDELYPGSTSIMTTNEENDAKKPRTSSTNNQRRSFFENFDSKTKMRLQMARDGCIASMVAVARKILDEFPPTDAYAYEIAFRWLIKAAREGSEAACILLKQRMIDAPSSLKPFIKSTLDKAQQPDVRNVRISEEIASSKRTFHNIDKVHVKNCVLYFLTENTVIPLKGAKVASFLYQYFDIYVISILTLVLFIAAYHTLAVFESLMMSLCEKLWPVLITYVVTVWIISVSETISSMETASDLFQEFVIHSREPESRKIRRKWYTYAINLGIALPLLLLCLHKYGNDLAVTTGLLVTLLVLLEECLKRYNSWPYLMLKMLLIISCTSVISSVIGSIHSSFTSGASLLQLGDLNGDLLCSSCAVLFYCYLYICSRVHPYHAVSCPQGPSCNQSSLSGFRSLFSPSIIVLFLLDSVIHVIGQSHLLLIVLGCFLFNIFLSTLRHELSSLSNRFRVLVLVVLSVYAVSCVSTISGQDICENEVYSRCSQTNFANHIECAKIIGRSLNKTGYVTAHKLIHRSNIIETIGLGHLLSNSTTEAFEMVSSELVIHTYNFPLHAKFDRDSWKVLNQINIGDYVTVCGNIVQAVSGPKIFVDPHIIVFRESQTVLKPLSHSLHMLIAHVLEEFHSVSHQIFDFIEQFIINPTLPVQINE